MNKKWLLPGLFVLSFLLLPTVAKASKGDDACFKALKSCVRNTGDVERCLNRFEACLQIFEP